MSRKAWVVFVTVQVFGDVGPWAGLRMKSALGLALWVAGILIMMPRRVLRIEGGSMSDGHDYATGLGFPGLDAGRITGFFGNPTTNMVSGFTQQWQVHGTGTVENIRMQFVSPIPAASIHSGMGAVAYPMSVEKAK